jgi:23S rRNA (cytosine1962-C5)-methyltransferase
LSRVYERSDAEVRRKEGLEPRKGLLKGAALDGLVGMKERGLRYDVDVDAGHKTGFYLDQRESRAKVRDFARGRRVLNCFSYTGGFAVAALAGGAVHTTSVDTSLPALTLGAQNAQHNGFSDDKHEWLRGDCFDVLRGLYDDGARFDLVVLDPPKFAPSASHVPKAIRGYRELNSSALRLLDDGGLLFTFSCSGAIDKATFHNIVADAALDAGRFGRVSGELVHPPDHPVALRFPEGEYLKGLVVRV